MTSGQRRVLERMAAGESLRRSTHRSTRAWFHAGQHENLNTVEALRVRGWIKWHHVDWSNARFTITSAGRAALRGEKA